MTRHEITGTLLPQSCVRVDLGGRANGSGFLVAPGHVVTCAHVVEPAEMASREAGRSITVIAADRSTVDAAVEFVDRDSDLACLRLSSALPSLPLAPLSADVRTNDGLVSFGFPERYPDGVPATFEAEGLHGGQAPLIKFKSGQVAPGMSGAPLLNLRTGVVCGVVRRTRDKTQALGGYGIPVGLLLERFEALRKINDQAVASDRRWLDLLDAEQRRMLQPVAVDATPQQEFVVTIEQHSDDGWRASATLEPGHECLGTVGIDLNVVRAEVARLFRAWRSQGRVDDGELTRLLGKVLYYAIFPQPIRRKFEERAFRAGVRTHVDVLFADDTDPDLAHLPWEHLYVPDPGDGGGVALGCDPRFTLTRVLSAAPASPAPARSSTLSVLLVRAPDPPEDLAGNVQEAIDAASRQLADQQAGGKLLGLRLVDAKSLAADQLLDALEEDEYDVVHYVGYGRFQGTDQLALSDDAGTEVEYLDGDRLATSLKPVRLVVLQPVPGPSSSRGPATVPADFSVIARRLCRGPAEAAVTFESPLLPKLADKFLERFYQELLKGVAVRSAAQSARTILHVRQSKVLASLYMTAPGNLTVVTPQRSVAQQLSAWGGLGG